MISLRLTELFPGLGRTGFGGSLKFTQTIFWLIQWRKIKSQLKICYINVMLYEHIINIGNTHGNTHCINHI